MTINLNQASGLRPNADTEYESAREWYARYTWYLSTDAGDVSVQAVQYDWLDDIDEAGVNLRRRHPGLTDDEAAALVAQAAAVREAAEDIEAELAAAVEAYEAGDLEECVSYLRTASDLEGDHGDDPATTALAQALLFVGHWRIRLWDEGGAEEEIQCGDDEPTRQEAEQECREWYSGDCGAYGFDPTGARVVVSWQILDPDGDEHACGEVAIDIPPDHEALIRRAVGSSSSAQAGCCGLDPDDHEWTSEGEGGCDSNPGVWSLGGTSMSFACHCRDCGLRRADYSTGSQCNPDDHDMVEYEMPSKWCVTCQSDDHDDEDCPRKTKKKPRKNN